MSMGGGGGSANVFLSPVLNGELFTYGNGAPLTNGTVEATYARTTLNANVYTDNTGANLHSAPIPLGANARLPFQIWIPQGQATRFIVYDSSNVKIRTCEDVLGVDDPSYECIQANLAYNLANAAFLTANNANNYANQGSFDANAAKVLANAAANTVAVYTNGTLIEANANINFLSTSTMNIVALANGSGQSNVSFTLNANSFAVLSANGNSNGWCNITANMIMQWGQFAQTSAIVGVGAGTPITVTFPLVFPTKCWFATASVTSSGSQHGAVLRINPGSIAAGTGHTFQIEADYFSGWSGSQIIYWFALGY